MKRQSRVVVAKLVGGLGNQLFIYFAALKFAEEHQRELILDISFIEQAHSLGESRLDSFLLDGRVVERSRGGKKFIEIWERFGDALALRGFKYLNRNYCDEASFKDARWAEHSNSIYLRGFHNTTEHYESLGRPRLKLKKESSEFKSLQSEISENVAIHIRGGDYVTHSDTFGPLSQRYYLNSLNLNNEVNRLAKSNGVYLFSDDRYRSALVSKELASQGYKVVDVSFEHNFAPAEELLLISSARAIVMANSTFSFWASEFSDDRTTIIAPSSYTRSGGAVEFESARKRIINQSEWE